MRISTVAPSEGDVEGQGRRDPENSVNDKQELESQKPREPIILEQFEPADRGVGLPPGDEDNELDRDHRHAEQGSRAADLVEQAPTGIRGFGMRRVHGDAPSEPPPAIVARHNETPSPLR
jgi:hypothetical protein